MNGYPWLRRHAGKIVAAIVLAVLAAWWVSTPAAHAAKDAVVNYGNGIPAPWFVLAFLLLPLTGFPFGVLLLIAGLRFGLAGGMILSAAGVTVHHVLAYHIARGWLHDWLQCHLARWGCRIPPVRADRHVLLTATVATVHGLPYAPKLYLLALTDVPFRVYLGVGAPVYVFFCMLPIAAGSAVSWFHPGWVYLVAVVFMVLLVASYGMGKYLQRKAAAG